MRSERRTKPQENSRSVVHSPMSRRDALGALALLGLLGVAACVRQPKLVPPPAVPRASFDPKDKRIAAFGAAQQVFAMDFLKQSAGGLGNQVVSPYSLSVGLAMLAQGAEAETLLQILSATQSAMGAKDLAYAVNAAELSMPPMARTKLTVASTLFIEQKLQMKGAFNTTLAKNFGVAVQRADFGDVDGAASAMNTWLAKQTSERISKLVYPSDFAPSARMVLVNAAYLLANWREQFDPMLTVKAFFNVGKLTKSEVMMMHASMEARYAQSGGTEVVTLPYQDDGLVATVIMPPLGSIEKFLAGLTEKRFTELLKRHPVVKIDLDLPRFQSRVGVDLAPLFKGLGVVDAFDGLSADFTAVTSKELHLDAAQHQSAIGVGEKGTEFIQAASSGAKPGTKGTEVRIDRPFLFLVRNTVTKAVLFASVVRDPSVGAD